MIRYLTHKEICYVNKKNIARFGGNYMPPENLLHPPALSYLVDIVSADLFGEPMYPEIHHKAGVYLYNIICNHIFSDGNKRTGLDACILFLELNGYSLFDDLDNKTLTNFILSVASGEQTLEQVQEWIQNHMVKKPV
jgi:death-on-curing protein